MGKKKKFGRTLLKDFVMNVSVNNIFGAAGVAVEEKCH